MRTLGRSFDIRAIWPQSAEHSQAAAREAARGGVELVIAMGGDGIVHHVAQGLVDTDTVLGIVPSGTTNVLARLLGIPSRTGAAIKMLAEGHQVVESPTVQVTAAGTNGSWMARAVFSLGIGPDAAVVEAAEIEPYRKYRFGSVHYARTAFGVVWSDVRRRKASVTIETPEMHRGVGAMVQFHRVYTYFGRVPLRLDREEPDPMSVLVIERLPIRRAASVLRRALAGTLGEVKGFTLDRRVAELRISADESVEVHMDGEHYGLASELVAVARPTGLRIAIPQASPR